MKKLSFSKQYKKAFTLIELLVVVSIIAVLAIVILVSLNPAKRMADTRDARRGQDLNQLLTGIHECGIDTKDTAALPTCLGTTTINTTYEIVTSGTTTGCNDICTQATSDTSCLALDTKLADYFVTLPADPITPAAGHTSYAITRKSNGMIVLEACNAEQDTIKVSR